MKILTVIGARPQFIKAAAVSRELRKLADEVLLHTGQHYDSNMSQIFFDELKIPIPDYNLGIGSDTHGKQTGKMLAQIEEICMKERPDRVLLYGDTNSTLAGALAAVKLQIPIAHVEAGLRSFNRGMPEEVNRVLSDHVSDLLFCPSQTAVNNLANEGISDGVYHSGDVMYEALMHAVGNKKDRVNDILSQLGIKRGNYALATVHRPENTDHPEKLRTILLALVTVAEKSPIIFAIHPRTKKKIKSYHLNSILENTPNLYAIEPLGYFDMVQLEAESKLIMTDSGGIQKEAFWMKIPCITMREETEWIETVEQGWNVLANTDYDLIVQRALSVQLPEFHEDPYLGKGSVSRIIERIIH